jgi:alkylhydroperoxidase/carboxymuconolactone decarboxylase family protein YurZ
MSTTTTPVCDALKAQGAWNSAWDDAARMAPAWTETFLAAGTIPWSSGVLDPKTLELIAIAVDASCTHLYAPGTRRHIARALDVGATPEEILAVLQAVAVLGIHSVALGAPILAEEMKRRGLDPEFARTQETSHAIP